MKSEIAIDKNQEEAELRLAKLVAALVREGIIFKVLDCVNEYAVQFEGGF